MKPLGNMNVSKGFFVLCRTLLFLTLARTMVQLPGIGCTFSSGPMNRSDPAEDAMIRVTTILSAAGIFGAVALPQ
jgi:hypothetical protein